MVMKKTRHLIVRISETQFQRLAETLITEQRNKSEILRDALESYMGRKGRRTEFLNHMDNKNHKSISQSERIPFKEKYLSLDVEDVFPATEFTEEEVEFVEHFLDLLRVDLESEVQIKYFLSASQLIYLLVGLKRQYDGFLRLDGSINVNRETQSPGETGYIIQSKPQKTPFV